MEAVAEADAGATEDTEVEDMVVAAVVEVVAEEEVVEGAMVITHMDLPAGAEHFWNKLVYTLQNNGD